MAIIRLYDIGTSHDPGIPQEPTHNDQPVPFQPVNPFLGEVADFVAAVQQHRPPCATLEDGLRNVAIMEAAREGPMQIALAARGAW